MLVMSVIRNLLNFTVASTSLFTACVTVMLTTELFFIFLLVISFVFIIHAVIQSIIDVSECGYCESVNKK